MRTRFLAIVASSKLLNAAGATPIIPNQRALLVLAVALAMPGVSLLCAQSPNTVALARDTCPQVRDGDIVTFSFAPQFDNPAAVRGLRNVELKFLHEGQPDPVNAPEAQFTLHAFPQRNEHEAPDAPMVASSNGSIAFRFRANLRSTSRGMFYLVAITGDPLLVPGYEGDTPKIINAIVRERLCLQVAPLQ
jgi:hypothetical protein